MEVLKIDGALYDRIKNCSSVNELADAVLQLTDELLVWQKYINDVLYNLDSENINEIDFSVTRCKNIDGVLEKYITK